MSLLTVWEGYPMTIMTRAGSRLVVIVLEIPQEFTADVQVGGRKRLGLVWAFDTSKPTPPLVTHTSIRPHFLIFLKQFHQLETKYLNMWASEDHSYSNNSSCALRKCGRQCDRDRELSRENVTGAQWPLCKSEQGPGACPCHRSVAACELGMNCLAA